ncbi:unnamed protein product [Protopolystoma xenopodis]|uniref:Uncharacterized protein n=1 Tax=Protopolystoma xenopodis TaxID=117903 RepID=A0A3S5APA1_9PLAT|nr:unnamed protein product [Protopolystoma xenopodis]
MVCDTRLPTDDDVQLAEFAALHSAWASSVGLVGLNKGDSSEPFAVAAASRGPPAYLFATASRTSGLRFWRGQATLRPSSLDF